MLAQWRSRAVKLFDVDRRAFTPTPKVTSSVVQITPEAPVIPDCKGRTLERVTAAAFGQRRKMLRSSLRALAPDSEALLAKAGIDSRLRAEQLSVGEFCQLAGAVETAAAE